MMEVQSLMTLHWKSASSEARNCVRVCLDLSLLRLWTQILYLDSLSHYPLTGFHGSAETRACWARRSCFHPQPCFRVRTLSSPTPYPRCGHWAPPSFPHTPETNGHVKWEVNKRKMDVLNTEQYHRHWWHCNSGIMTSYGIGQEQLTRHWRNCFRP